MHKKLRIAGFNSLALLHFRYIDGSTRYLHHNFLAILLNDLFGIQARGGCACAGPYAEVCLSDTELRLIFFAVCYS